MFAFRKGFKEYIALMAFVKRNGVCPKCGGKEIYDDSDNARLRNNCYVCAKCGFIEWYAPEKQLESLAKLHKKGNI